MLGAQKRLRILCVREFQKSIADSVHRLLQDQIELLKIPGYNVTLREITHVGTGTVFIFEGLRYNVNRIKSIEGVDICWAEEAESISAESWEILIPTIRKAGSEIWISFNPYMESDPTYQRFVVHAPPNAISKKIGWEDNPWFTDEMREEKDYLYEVDPEAAEYVWGGMPRKFSQSQILHGKWKVEAFEPEAHWLGPYYGMDFGFSKDPTALVEVYIAKDPGRPKSARGRLMIRREAWKLHLENDHIIPYLYSTVGSNISKQLIRADSSRPETISYLKRHGLYRIRSVYKWPNSIEDGIAYLRSFEEIVIHPDCPHTKEEAVLYSFKVDEQTQEVLRKIVDKHNHTWDAVRYALAPIIRIARGAQSHYGGTAYANA